ncbi:DUF5320 domain-containing protein [Candidatus Woesearchaeota archaeon]|nr:DUF5320 domain-containing protein [Candidatus Woesearchaeota archaeon]
MSYYVPLENPTELQKQVLTASKKVLGVLKSHENYKKIRTEKLEHILKFKKVLDDLTTLNKKLSNKLPKTAMPKPKEEKQQQPKKHLSAVEKELEDIEKRLKSLEK